MAIDSCRTSDTYVNFTEKCKGTNVGGDFRGASFSFFYFEKNKPACRLQAFHSFEEIGQKRHRKKETFLPSMKTGEKRRT